MHRRMRVSPAIPLKFKQWTIPAGIPVGMSAYYAHRDATVFPHPEEFLPERWLSDVTPAMNRNFVPFSKGSRRCLGMKYVSCFPFLQFVSDVLCDLTDFFSI